MEPGHAHPARELSVDERVDYLIAVAAVVYADEHVAESELHVLRELCETLALPEERVGEVLAAAHGPDHARVHLILERYRARPERFALLTDAILVAFADGKVAPGETEQIAELAQTLGIHVAEAILIGRYVEEVVLHDEHRERSKALAEGLAEAASHVHPPRGVRWLYHKLVARRPR